jgi:uncharacterized repeat protein (TIGR04138 family)
MLSKRPTRRAAPRVERRASLALSRIGTIRLRSAAHDLRVGARRASVDGIALKVAAPGRPISLPPTDDARLVPFGRRLRAAGALVTIGERLMPPAAPKIPEKSLDDIVAELNVFPLEAFVFVQEGLSFTVGQTHGPRKKSDQNMHVNGQQFAEGLRQYAFLKYGMLAGAVLRRWGIRRTIDFGRIVYAMVESGYMSKTDDDSLADFDGVYDFSDAFDAASYKIELPAGKP